MSDVEIQAELGTCLQTTQSPAGKLPFRRGGQIRSALQTTLMIARKLRAFLLARKNISAFYTPKNHLCTPHAIPLD